MRGFCACGCGKPTSLYSETNRRRGQVKGEPAKFIQGHQHRVYRANAWNAHEPAWYLQEARKRA